MNDNTWTTSEKGTLIANGINTSYPASINGKSLAPLYLSQNQNGKVDAFVILPKGRGHFYFAPPEVQATRLLLEMKKYLNTLDTFSQNKMVEQIDIVEALCLSMLEIKEEHKDTSMTSIRELYNSHQERLTSIREEEVVVDPSTTFVVEI